jgi:hypothetical protein
VFGFMIFGAIPNAGNSDTDEKPAKTQKITPKIAKKAFDPIR